MFKLEILRMQDSQNAISLQNIFVPCNETQSIFPGVKDQNVRK
jgi:hypothetical protein